MKKEIAFKMLETTMVKAGEVQLIEMEKDSPAFIKYRTEMIEESVERLEYYLKCLQTNRLDFFPEILRQAHKELEIIYFNLGHKTKIQ